MLEPHLHLLGVERTADPATLLGLTAADARDPLLIDRALRLRLAQVYQHPDHRAVSNSDMQRVLKSLREAAAKLRKDAKRLGPIHQPRPWVLTEFDRNVLATLVGCGGWNAHSRARLVALAADQGVTPSGLLKVIQGLGEYAKSGGPALPIAEMRPSPAIASANGVAGGRSSPISDAIIERLLPELKEESALTTVKLSLFFGLLTLLIGVIALRVLLPVRHLEPTPDLEAPAAVETESGRDAGSPRERRIPATPTRDHRALFTQRPTFLAESHPPEAMHASENIAEEIAALEDVARRLAVTEQEPAEIVFRYWSVAIERIAIGWLLLDGSTRERVEGAVLDVLFAAADKPTVTDRLLRELMPRSGRLLQPLDIWRGAFAATVLGRITKHEHLPPVVRERANSQLQVAIGTTTAASAGSTQGEGLLSEGSEDAASTAAQAYLASVMPQLVEHVEYDPAAYDYWELWLGAHRRISGGEQYNEALMEAADAILRVHGNLSASRRAANVLGRLMEQADLQHSAITRRRVIGWFESDAIGGDGLWTLTSILAFDDIAPAFSRRLIVPPEASPAVRARFRDDVERWWRLPYEGSDTRAGAIAVEEAAAAHWRELLLRVHAETFSSAEQNLHLMRQLLLAAKLNEAAAVLASAEPRQAERRFQEIQDLLSRQPDSMTSRPTGRQSGAPAGDWAARYDASRRNTEEKLRLLAELHDSQLTDLDLLDAAVLVREAIRGTPADVRMVAHSVLMQQFKTGRHVALELLDQLPDAGRSQYVSDLISEYTGSTLPLVFGGAGRQMNDWAADARLVLVNHALSLWGDDALDSLTEQLATSYADQSRALLGRPRGESRQVLPESSAEMLLDAWSQMARSGVGIDIASYESRELANRHAIRLALAEGSVQRFIANQIGVLEIMAIVIAREQPHQRDRLSRLLNESRQRRNGAEHALAQAVEVERTINLLWQLRIGQEQEVSSREEPLRRLPSRHIDISAFHAAVLCMPSYMVRELTRSDWTQRLEALDPGDPIGYFLLAEEMADSAGGSGDVELARQLFALSAVLAPDRLGRSACIALADLADEQRVRRRYIALASLLTPGGGVGAGAWGDRVAPSRPPWVDPDAAAVLALCDALSFHRRGHGTRATSRLTRGDAVALLQSLSHALPSDTVSALMGGSQTPRARLYQPTQTVRMLYVEAALLAGTQRTWSSDLVLTQRNSLIEVDPDRLEEALDVDASRPRYRNGRWVQ